MVRSSENFLINLQQGFDGGGVLRQARHFFFELVLAAGVVEGGVD